MPIKTQDPGLYQTLAAQLDKTARHDRQGSSRTKERCYITIKGGKIRTVPITEDLYDAHVL